MPTSRQIPMEILRRLKAWGRAASIHQTMAIWLNVLAGISGLVVAAFADVIGLPVTRLLGFLAAACVAYSGTVKPQIRGSRYRSAWRVLDDACKRYQLDSHFPETGLADALRQGEGIIGDLDA